MLSSLTSRCIFGFILIFVTSHALSNTEFTYNALNDGIEVTGCVGTCPSDLVIPDSIDGYTVTSIGASAFDYSQLTNVTLPDSVTSIGESAFYWNSLTNINLPDNLEVIGNYAFARNSFNQINLPDSLITISDYAFEDSYIETLIVPSSVETIGRAIFKASSLNTIAFMGDRPEISNAAFVFTGLELVLYCEGTSGWPGINAINGSFPQLNPNCVTDPLGEAPPPLEFNYEVDGNGIRVTGCKYICPQDLVIPDAIDGLNVTSIGYFAFQHRSLKTISIPNTVATIDDGAFYGNKLVDLDIPKNVIQIGTSGFNSNPLENIILPDGLNTIERYTFYGHKLSSVRFLGNRPEIKSNAFTPCCSNSESFTILYCPSTSDWTDYTLNLLEEGTFDNIETGIIVPQLDETCDSDGDGDINTEDAFPFDATETLDTDLDGIGNNTDIDDDNDGVLDEHDSAPLDDSVGVEFDYSFVDDGIEVDGCIVTCPPDLIIPESIDGYSVTGIDSFAFGFNELTSIVFPNTLTSIGSFSFQHNKLTSLIIPESVTEIGSYAFYQNELSSVTIPNTLSSLTQGVFSNNELTNIIIPISVIEIGKTAFGYNELESIIIPDSVTDIGESAFISNNLSTLIVPNGISTIGYRAFAFNQLTNVSFLGNPPEIDSAAFEYNSSLNTISYCQNTNMAWDNIDIEGIVFEQDPLCQINWDFDKNGTVDALTDGLLLLRHAFGLYGELLIDTATGVDSILANSEIEAHLEKASEIADIDNNGSVSPLSDGLLLLRYTFGIRGNDLIKDVVSEQGTRNTAEAIEAYIESHMLN